MQNLLPSSCKMHSFSLQPSPFTQSVLPGNNLAQQWRLFGPSRNFFIPNEYPGCTERRRSYIVTAQSSSGITRFSAATVEATPENVGSKVEETVFVAGATGKVGSRTVRELLKIGFKVRAGVRSAQRAETLIKSKRTELSKLLKYYSNGAQGPRQYLRDHMNVQSVKDMKLDTEDSNELTPIEKLEIVECDLERPDQIVPALGSASIVICCIGASEKEIFDVTGPYRIDYQATKNLITSARVAKIEHFILLTSLGTNKIGFPAAILNLFWGVLVWKRKAEEELIASGLPYTIVRPGGMERPTDSYKETHNITLSQEDTLFGGQVSNLQVAELISVMAKNRELSYCKVVEVVAETTAPLTPMEDLLSKIPSERKYVPKAKQEVIPKPVAPEPAKTSIPDTEADVPVEESVQISSKVAKPTPLSPYTAYADLKPPTSPTPSPPNIPKKEVAAVETTDAPANSTIVPGIDAVETTDAPANSTIVPGIDAVETTDAPANSTIVPSIEVLTDATESDAAKVQKSQPLSPYTAYEDLKPPTSPTPSAPGTSDGSIKTQIVLDGVATLDIVNGTLPESNPRESTFYNSPFPVYDDLRPPTSPTPSAPKSIAKIETLEADTSSLSTDNGAEPSISSVGTVEPPVPAQNPAEPKSRPLSPYTMYEDMKPPTSPTPTKP